MTGFVRKIRVAILHWRIRRLERQQSMANPIRAALIQTQIYTLAMREKHL